MRFVRALMAAAVIAMIAAPAALAQGPIEMTSAYPSLVADPGAKVTFSVKVTTAVAERVDLSIVTQPDGWKTVLRGGGTTIGAVSTQANPDVAGEISALYSVETTVPEDVQPGSNQIVVEGRTASGSATRITLDIVTEAQEPGSVALESAFPSLKGAASSTFRFNLTLTNNTNTQLTFGMESDAPAGWTVDARPAGEAQAAAAVVDAGASANITATVDPPSDAPAGMNDITVRAVSGSFVAEAPLSVEITGNFAVSLETSDQRLNARVSAGNPTVLNLVVTNTGTAPLTGLKLTSTPPSKWKIDFAPSTFDTPIEPQTPGTATATIIAPSDALAGDYIITIRVSGDNGVSNSIDIRTTVETSPLGYVIGIAVLVAVAVGLFFVFQRYGRR